MSSPRLCREQWRPSSAHVQTMWQAYPWQQRKQQPSGPWCTQKETWYDLLMLPTYHIINTQYLVINKTIDIQLYYGNYLADLLVLCVFDMHLNCLAVKIQFLLKISLWNIQSFIRRDWYNIQFISYIFIYLTWYLEMKKKIIISFLDIDAINI